MTLVEESTPGENHLPDPWTIMEATRSTRMWKKKGRFTISIRQSLHPNILKSILRDADLTLEEFADLME